jgi:glutamate dehydrogenase/leucine dehydrogenase
MKTGRLEAFSDGEAFWQTPITPRRCSHYQRQTSETKNKNMKIVILGGRGLIGGKVVDLLRSGGHEVVAASPSQGINSITREGLTEAITGAQVVVDVTNSPSFEDKAVLEFFETSTRNVLAAEYANQVQ